MATSNNKKSTGKPSKASPKSKAKSKGTVNPPSQKKSLKTENRASDSKQNTENHAEPRYITRKDGITQDYANVGRPSTLEQIPAERFETVVDMISNGIENYKVADYLNISLATFYRGLRQFAPLRDAYQKGMDNRAYRLEQALFKRAEGFTATETKKEVDAEGNLVKTTVTDKHFVPDTTALIFALKNVMPDKYKDRVEQTITHNITVENLGVTTTEQLLSLLDKDKLGAIDVPFNIEE